jgi:hypothetical protein
MVRLAAIALTSVLGVAGLASAAPAAAEPYVTVGVPVAYGPVPHGYARGPWYWHRDFYPHGFYRDHFRSHGSFDHYRR